MLHIINQSPFRNTTLNTSLRFIKPSDPVLFYEDGVYALKAGGAFAEVVQKLQKTNPVYGLGPDIQARGLKDLVKDVTVVGYDGFVDLVEEHQVNSWL